MGHPGIEKMVELLQRNYCWSSLWWDVTEYVRMCIPCQQMKVFLSQASGLLSPLPLPKEPWEQVMADFIVELPESQGYDVILVAADCHTVSNQPSLVKMATHPNKVSRGR
jgi:hypothetical protein